jgi:GTP-binding protein HflX
LSDHHLQGNLLGLKPRERNRLAKLSERKVNQDQIVSPELARSLSEISREIGRQVGVLLDRRGRVQDVFVGDAKQITITGLGRYRAGRSRLRGLRLVHTHLKGEPLSSDDLTDLALLRFDLVAAIEAGEDGLPGKVYWAHLRPAGEAGDPWTLLPSISVHALPQDFQSFISHLEVEISQSVQSTRHVSQGRRAMLVGVTTGPVALLQQHMQELQALAESADMEVIDTVTQRRSQLDPRYVVGEGKMKELYIRCLQQGIDLLVFDGELQASQNKAISAFGELEVWDRTQLILEIFARRAHSRGGKLQVELAQLKYSLPRLVGRDDFLSRLAGGIGARGPGETKMDVLKSRVRDRITRLERELKGLSQERRLRRERRSRSDVQTISIVGYTNAGKSTLLNTLTHAGVLTENKMFATLDPTSRQLRLPSGKRIILTDTVGFIRDLPEDLGKAFRATLEELNEADVLLHLLDASNPEFAEQKEAVERILDELALDNIPTLVVLNKWDALDPERQIEVVRQWPNYVQVSALGPQGPRGSSEDRPSVYGEQLDRMLESLDRLLANPDDSP